MTIINIAGTSGSGKSTLVRNLISELELVEQIKSDTKWKQLGSIYKPKIFIAGRYDSYDTGGCDTIKDVDLIYTTIEHYAMEGYDVIYEGLFCMNHTRGLEMVRKGIAPVHIIHLTTPIQQCKDSINERRIRRGQGPFTGSWDNTKSNVTRATNFAFKLKAIGATVHKLDREAAAVKLRELISPKGKRR